MVAPLTLRRLRTLLLILHPSSLILLLSGCAGSGPETCTVSGTVTFNGAPVPEGNVIFAPEDGQGVEDAGAIRGGKYRLEVKPGRKKVRIHATRPTGEVDKLMGMAPRQEYIPPRYNVHTELRAEVKPGGKNEFPFALEGPAPGKP